MQCKIVIPSYKRADRVISKEICRDVILCVPESQTDEYKYYNHDVEIVSHPDSVIGLPAKRNWMVKHFKELFMMDDDIQFVHNLMTIKGESSPTKGESSSIRDKDEIYEIIQKLYSLAKLLDVSLFGFGNIPTPMQYTEFEPYKLTNRVNGCSYGVIYGENTIWNEDIPLKEDFWISGYVLYKERKILVDNRYHFEQKDTFVNPGGLSEFRSSQTEMKSILAIRKYFGESILMKNKKFHVNKKVKYNISSKFRI